MITQEQFDSEVKMIIANAIREDVGDGDHSSLACIPENARGRAKLLVKDKGIIGGVNFAKKVFAYVDKRLKLDVLIEDGTEVTFGDIVMYVEGPSQSILKAERTVLNAMQRMSAIATKTRVFVDLLEGTVLEKWAVKIGGGENHRFALYDMIMLKDNHIDFAGGITKAIDMAKEYLNETGKDLDIMVEARDLGEVEEILKSDGVYRILIDNFDYEDTRKAVKMIGNKCLTESSGNINEATIRHYAECGVNYISSGALTHSVHNMDLSLKAVK